MGVDTAEIDFAEADYHSDDDVPDEAHNKLLNAVSQLYKKQRIEAPKRREPAQEISEFNLSANFENKSSRVNVSDLLKDLKEKVTHKEINAKVRAAQKKSRTLPKPLEKNEADKISREVGYQNVKKKLDKWNSIVERNKLADQLTFPLVEQNSLNSEPPKPLRKPTELEKAMAEVLDKSEIAKEEKKIEESLSKLSVEEMIQRRKMIAKMRARESYRIAKAVRQNKIKSKKYHRILKKERIKQELKDFEKLQKTDPEAALAKLEQIERARAEERISLRHRNTGKWARSRAIRAKYDTEARRDLAEQLAKSRELTRKIKINDDSNSDEEMIEDDDEDDQSKPSTTSLNPESSNPWIKGSIVHEFITGFEKFSSQVINRPSNEKELPATEEYKTNHISSCNTDSCDPIQNTENVSTANENQEQNNSNSNVSSINEANLNLKHVDSLSPNELKLEYSSPDLLLPSKISDKSTIENISTNKVTVENLLESFSQNINYDTEIQLQNRFSLDVKAKGEVSISTIEDSSNIGSVRILPATSNKIEQPVKNVEKLDNSGHLSPNEKKQRNYKNKNSPVNVNKDSSPAINIIEYGNNISSSDVLELKSAQKDEPIPINVGSFSVLEENDTKSTPKGKNNRKTKEKSLTEIFDDAEDAIQNHTKDMARKLKLDLLDIEVPEDDNNLPSKSSQSKLSRKNIGIDEALIEIHHQGISSGINDVKSIKDKLLCQEKVVTKEPQIDPNKHINVKPQKLFSEIGTLEEAGDESDEENIQKMDLMEAFADDDIVEHFRKEKEEESKKNKAQEISLEMPGWGSWGGTNIKRKAKRKRRRFIVRLPKVPRKDEKKEHVIINEDPVPALRNQLVNELPYPFTSVKDYEASIRAPLGKNWVPERAHRKLTAPPVVTKMGTIIEPMSDPTIPPTIKKKRRLK